MDQSYTKFCVSMKAILPLLSLEDVLEFIRQKKGVKEQLVTIQIDETQVNLIVSSFNTFPGFDQCEIKGGWISVPVIEGALEGY
jgi:hypothetical protein